MKKLILPIMLSALGLASCHGISSKVISLNKNPAPKVSINGVSDCQYRLSNYYYSDGRDATQNCEDLPFGGQKCTIVVLAVPKWENEKNISSYSLVESEGGLFKINVEYVNTYELSASVGYLDEEGKPLVNDVRRWYVDDSLARLGRLYSHEVKDNSLSLPEYDIKPSEAEGSSIATLAILLNFTSPTYGSADFIFFAKA